MNEVPHSSGITDIARSAVDGLKANPTCLAVVALAMVFAALIYWGVTKEREQSHVRALEMLQIVQACLADKGIGK